MSVLAFDLGASSGRAVLGTLKNGRLEMEEIHHFDNDPVQAAGRLHWDILRLYHEIKQGLLKAKLASEEPLEGIGIDSWAVDFGLIGSQGELLGNPYHYRDHHTAGIMDEVAGILSADYIFKRTGIQFLPFNTIYQLYALKKRNSFLLKEAKALLMIPDLIRYFLTGKMHSEFTNASTTQLLSPITGKWDLELINKLGLPSEILLEPVQPGTVIGPLQEEVAEELGMDRVPVIAVAEHDTASAVAAVPSLSEDFAYLSCGTWSLLGTEVKKPVLTDQALALNFTNEGGVSGTYRLLKNIMGLWLLQECKRVWEKEGKNWSYAELVQMAAEAPAFESFVDPDDEAFLNPAHMPRAIAEYCRKTKQPVPESPAEFVRCILESLALKYRYVYTKTEQLSGKVFGGLHMVGGGIHNELLCQWTANALQKPVWAGPAEGSAIGNIVVQCMALGKIEQISDARKLIRQSFAIQTYEPKDPTEWEQAYQIFLQRNHLSDDS